MQLMHFVEDLGVQIIGGCCGTRAEHIQQLAELSQGFCSPRKGLWAIALPSRPYGELVLHAISRLYLQPAALRTGQLLPHRGRAPERQRL